MADSEGIGRIQFVEEIHPVKTAGSAAYRKELAAAEKTRGDFDAEERAVQLATADLNSKKKQVGKLLSILRSREPPLLETTIANISKGLYRMDFAVACIPK